MLPMAARSIKAYRTRSGECPFRKWYWSLRQRSTQLAIDTRVNRLAIGNPGDCKTVGEGVYELRIHDGPGYRVYFAYDGLTLVLLLVGGDKSTQPKDIEKAQAFLKDYELQKGADDENENTGKTSTK